MLNFEKGFIDFNRRMSDALNHHDGEYAMLCTALEECQCLVDDIDLYMTDIKIMMDRYEDPTTVYEMENRVIYKNKALEDKQMIEKCISELGDYGFKVEGEPEFDERLNQFI